MDPSVAPYYRHDLALVHHLGFAKHAENCAPGILKLLEPVKARNGLVVELGCGTGLLTRFLLDAGHRVIATDASPAMLALAQELVPDAEDIRLLALPDDPIPEADAVVSVGHVLSYLSTDEAVRAALVASADALRPDGVLALDLCDLSWADARRDTQGIAKVTDTWAIVTEYSLPSPRCFVRDMTVFVRNDDGTWRRDDEHHENVLIDTATVPALLEEHGVSATVAPAFGHETLPAGLVAVVGRRR